MSIKNQISKLVGNYGSLSFPVLGILNLKGGVSYLVNDTFEKTFLSDFHMDFHIKIIKKHLNQLEERSQIHHKGNIYKIDEFSILNGVKYYFYSLTNQSVQYSFLWLKHDLLNILNPIMGFSDVLSESEDLIDDDQLLVKKIRTNSNKLYRQIQNLALLQSLENKSTHQFGTYEIEDFVKELINQLIANQTIDHPPTTFVSHQGKVSNRIIQSDFRTSLEEHINFLTQFQTTKEIECRADLKQNFFHIQILFPNCVIPSSYIEMIEEIDSFVTLCTPIKKLQVNGLNYLILNEICETFGAKIEQEQINKEVKFTIELPSLSTTSELTSFDTALNKSSQEKNNQNFFQKMPTELVEKMKPICQNFDGLLILDEWQQISEQLKGINKSANNDLLEKIIEEIDSGIQSFDVEKLRKIFNQCKENIV